jgi:serine/threonine-protein kinase RsbW
MSEHSGSQSKTVEMLLSSTLESVDLAESEVIRVAELAGLEEESRHRLGMAVRESMVNAVVHGNRYSPEKSVQLRVAWEPDRLVVQITDEGDGFELSSVPDPLAQENLLRQSGRGILLIQAFVDEFRVRRRGGRSGTEARLVKYLSRGT